MHIPAAIYARVSSDRQKEQHTIASQTAALIAYAQTHGYTVPPAWVFQDEGYSGALLVRPGLEALPPQTTASTAIPESVAQKAALACPVMTFLLSLCSRTPWTRSPIRFAEVEPT